MSTDTDILHLKTQFEHLKDNLAKGSLKVRFQLRTESRQRFEGDRSRTRRNPRRPKPA